MAILDGLQQFLELFRAQVIDVPLNNFLSYLYVIFNNVLNLIAMLMGGTISGTGIFPDIF